MQALFLIMKSRKQLCVHLLRTALQNVEEPHLVSTFYDHKHYMASEKNDAYVFMITRTGKDPSVLT